VLPYHVPTSAVPLLEDPPFVLALALLAAAIGHRLLRVLGASADATALERGTISAALGLGLLQYLPFGLGMAGALTPRAVWIGLAGLYLLFARDAVDVARGVFRGVQRLRGARPPRWITWGLALLAIPLGVMLLGALAPPTDHDGLYYQLTAPKRWLQHGELIYLPTLLHTNLVMGVNMLFTLALAVHSDTAAKLIHYLHGALALLAIFALGRRLSGPSAGFAAASVWFVGFYPVWTLDASRLFSFAYVDLGVALDVVCAALSFLLWTRSRSRGWLLAAALCSGFAATTKLNGALIGGALAAVVVADLRRDGQPWARSLLAGAGFGALSALPAVPWFVRSWLLTGSPVYLLFARLFPTRDWSPTAAETISIFFRYYFWGTGFSSVGWSLAVRKAVLFASMAATAAGGAVVIWRWKNWEARALAFLAMVWVLGSFSSTGLYLRYILPAMAIGYVLAFSAASHVLESARWLRGAVLAVISVNSVLMICGNKPSLLDTAGAATGAIGREEFLARQIPVIALWEFVNRTVPPDARILLAAGRPSYYLDPICYVTEAYYQNHFHFDEWESFLADVRRDRIGYVIVSKTSGASNPTGPDYAAARNERPFVRRLVDQYGRLLSTVGTDRLYRLEGL
jgi:hypothetical protein